MRDIDVPNCPAFPSGGKEGMELRDWFAGLAMQGMFAAGVPSGFTFGDVADKAYLAADAMLKERAR
jgi:hypothetical protein